MKIPGRFHFGVTWDKKKSDTLHAFSLEVKATSTSLKQFSAVLLALLQKSRFNNRDGI